MAKGNNEICVELITSLYVDKRPLVLNITWLPFWFFPQLIGRFGTLEESGEAFLYLAAEGTFCTGIDLLLSGCSELNYGNKNRTRENAGIYE